MFRYLVLGNAALFILYVVLPMLGIIELEQQEYDLLSYSGYGGSIPEIVGWVQLILWLVSAVGLYLFQNWARTLFLVLIVFDAFSIFLGGYVVLMPLEAFMANLIAIADGAILVLAYFTTVSKEFGNVAPNKTN